MVNVTDKPEEISPESIKTTIEIAKKLEKEDKFIVYPHTDGVVYRLKEREPLSINGKEQDRKTFTENMKHIQHVALHILIGTEKDIKNKYGSEVIDIVRNNYIDETFRGKFFVGKTSKSYLFIEVDYSISNKVATSEIAINPPVPYLTLWFDLIESLVGETKKIPIDIDIPTFQSLVKQINEINEKLKIYVK